MISRRSLLFCFAAFALIVSTGLTKEAAGKWEKEIPAFEPADKQNPPKKGGILFIGSSSIRLWKSLEKDFPHHHVLNRGFGGSELSDSIEFTDRIVFPYEPRTIVMYAGTNDINNGKSAEQVAADFKIFTEKVREKLPTVRIMYIAVAGNPARWKQVEQVKQTNKLIEEYCQSTPGMTFIDVFSKMLGEDGLPRPEIFSEDKLHMNEKGYELWRDIVGPHLGPADSEEGTVPAPKTISDPKPAASSPASDAKLPVPTAAQ